MSPTSTPRPEPSSRRADLRGWLVLAWVAVWSVAYVHSAIGERFPWVRTWLDRLF